MTIWLALAVAGALIPAVAWLGYPWLMIKLGERRPVPIPVDPPPDCRVSVILATREPVAAVARRLADLGAGEWPAERLELIVAVDGDPAPYQFPTPEGGAAVRVVSRGAEPGKAAALNAGVAAATGEVLVFADTAQRFGPDTIRRLVGGVHAPGTGAVSGALVLAGGSGRASPIERYWALEKRLRAAESRVHSTIGVTGAVYAMRRELWTPLPPGLILDDLWIPMRLILAGHRVGFDPGARAWDDRTTTPDQEYRRKVRTLTGNFQLVAWLPVILVPWRNPAWVQFWCHKLLRLATPYALVSGAAGVVGMAMSISSTLGWWLMGAAAGLGILPSMLPGRMGHRWREGLRWTLTMLAAIVTATWNAVRRDWNVWRPTGAPSVTRPATR